MTMVQTARTNMFADLAVALDPVRLAKNAGMELDPWQAEAARYAGPQMILNCSRQSGKSTVVALLAIHTAIYHPGALILLLSRALRQSKELFRKVTDFYRLLDKPVPPETDNRLELELMNRSRIISLPGSSDGTIRGFSGVRLLIVDEAAWVSEALYYAIRPMLAVSQGRIVLLSTPFGKRGFFHQEWTEGNGWKRIQITARECPRISPGWLEDERRRIGDFWFDQEYLCMFKENIDSVFTHEDIMAAVSDEVQPLAF